MLCDDGVKRIKELRVHFTSGTKAMLGIVLLASLLLVGYWAQQDRFVYYWDYGTYWSIAIDRMEYMFTNSFGDIMKSLLESINRDDYNLFLPSLIALPLKICGNSFFAYVIINSVMFLIPTMLVQGLVAIKLWQNTTMRQDRGFVLAVFLAACFSGNYYALLKGFIDVAYLLPMSIVMYLWIDYDFNHISLQRNIAIGLLFVIMWISRRYVIYFIIGTVCILVIKAIGVLNRNRNIKQIKIIALNLISIGSISIGILLLLFQEFFLKSLLTNYGNIYSAYDAPLATKWNHLSLSFGNITLLLILISVILSICFRKNRENVFSLITMLIIETTLFWSTQSMGVHHRMLLNVPVFMLELIVIGYWQQKPKTRVLIYTTKGLVLCYAGLLIVNFSISLLPGSAYQDSHQLFAEKYYPMQRDDIDALNDLVDQLNEYTDDTQDYVYCLASGTTLNSDVINKLRLPHTSRAVPNLFATHDVDLRDGFPSSFLQAKYVVTTVPIQIHLISGQEVVSYLATQVNDPMSSIGNHFELLDTYELDNGITACIYKKTSAFTENDLQEIRDYFSALYPDNPELFADRIK